MFRYLVAKPRRAVRDYPGEPVIPTCDMPQLPQKRLRSALNRSLVPVTETGSDFDQVDPPSSSQFRLQVTRSKRALLLGS